MRSFRAFIVATLLLTFLPGAGASPPLAQAEAVYLISLVEGSGCTFYRNGAPYDSVRAAAHLREKYAAADATGAVATAELFIEKVASGSSLTGRPYEVTCAGVERRTVTDWLLEELARHRANEAPRELRGAR